MDLASRISPRTLSGFPVANRLSSPYRGAVWLTVILAIAFWLTGCQTPPPISPATPTPSSQPLVTLAPPPAGTNPVNRANLADTGIVRLVESRLPDTWNPQHPSGPPPSFSSIVGPLLANFVHFDSHGTATLNPDFLVSAVWTTTTTLTLTQNNQAKWADDTPITGNDWVATWQALNGSNPAFQTRSTWGWSQISDVAATGNEIKLTFLKPFPQWQYLVRFGPMRAESVATPEVFNSWTIPKTGWFSGPFTVSHIDSNPRVVTMARNPHYPVEPRLERVTFRVLPPTSAKTAWQLSELDAIDLGRGLPALNMAKRLGVSPRWGADGSRLVLQINPVTVPNQTLRQAVGAALDPHQLFIASGFNAGEFTPANNLLFWSQQTGYTDSAVTTGLIPDTGVTRQILATLGWRFISGFWVKDGSPLTLKLAAGPQAELTEELKSQLREVGIQVEIVTADSTEWQLRVDTVTLERFATENLAALQNKPGEIDALVGQVASETDEIRRQDLLTQAANLSWSQAITVPLFAEPEGWAAAPKLANFGPLGLASGNWADVGWTR